ncbi:conserved membrane hypothetical protein [uncultured Alphaproteobacteria bacterium]|uniref:Inner membrane protein n=1 Tax=uncultured Alphaproteobacteria bacterium TaxID=91750 RepID=A0A212KLQ1_9PROT|nr:conserved membrane hypothetical protein [uncultured Alphaproteobacteria bacterium]
MSGTDPFSLAQCLGYVAFALGVSAFLQRDDRRLKLLNSAQGVVYAVHFAMLGAPALAGSAAVCALRSGTAAFYRRGWLALPFTLLNLAIGWWVARTWVDWLPVIGFVIGTVSVFLLRGVPLRAGMFLSSAVVMVAALLSGSIGGVALEASIAAANLVTIFRLQRLRQVAA